jgi:hypothetical protein
VRSEATLDRLGRDPRHPRHVFEAHLVDGRFGEKLRGRLENALLGFGCSLIARDLPIDVLPAG